MNKFNAKRVKTADGTFDSKREYKMWLDLKDTQEKGLIKNLKRQVSFLLIPKQIGERQVEYVADFVYIIDNTIMDMGEKILIVADLKSKVTAKDSTYIIKRKLFKYNYITNKAPKLIEKQTGFKIGEDYDRIIFQEIL